MNNIIELPNGEYFYIEERNNKLIAGSCTNCGIIEEYSVDYDGESLQASLEMLYDEIMNDYYKNNPLSENEFFDILEDEFTV